MKICSVCQRCYEDTTVVCTQENHDSPVAARSGSCEIANYRLDRLLGRDVTGETYLATQLDSDEPFTVRFIAADLVGESQSARESLLDEMRAAARINHPNIERIIESGVLENGEFYLVTESNDGQTLREYLRNVGSLPESIAVNIAQQAAEGLEAAHQVGIVHRGISPANIILIDDGQNPPSVKLQNFDFGGVKQQIVTSNLNDSEPSIDILRYLSPEQCAGQTTDARTDIYSIGVVLYEMLIGRSPFDKPTFEAIIHKRINEQPLERLPFDTRALIKHALQRALQKKPSARTPTALNFARHLRHIAQIATHSSVSRAMTAAAIDSNDAPAPVLDDSFIEKPRPQIPVLAGEEVTTGTGTNSFVPLSVENNVEEDAEIETTPIFQTEQILVKKKQVDETQFDSEPILVKRRDTETNSFASEPIRIKKIKKRAAVAAQSASEPIFSPAQSVPKTPMQTAIPNSINSFDASHASRRIAPTRQFLFVGIGLAVLLAFAALGALVYNRQFPQSAASQPITAAPSSTSQPENAVADTRETAAITDSDVSESDESALVTTEDSGLPVSKRNDKIQPREELPAREMSAKQNAPLEKIPAPEKPVPLIAELDNQNQAGEVTPEGSPQAELNTTLDKWITATNARDVDGQMSYYAPRVDAYYRTRNTSQNAVRTDKIRAFERATSVDIKTDKPEITVSPNGRSAKMRFRKKYVIKEGQRSRNGEVIQELQWVKSDSGWRIVSERDIKVVNR
ncbi:MAG: protein kinase domain-containing protein [Pyrinomonadaceae bacterium]